MATGWLGWPPDLAWSTPMPELFLAMDAKIEWAQMTNPFGGGKAKAKADKPSASTVADKLRQALTGRQAT
ncbi:hypothetical protein [Pseudomonas extremaustralis]|uniref:Uncharacterized protein n=1 Tax=Pseudomonas extremaustralis TaxID=359110 RepID=A0A5C5QFG3_9PSED|nr:hypothetical protein [Pseudomonas extremaustralis]EZI28955.1 hypothetical protein PE143B_0109840 [Pseudomonas extremaustralis 14-3 substr. 14-3b]TWS04132.1 hypothetical protein FIV36_14390 [Pseudomonas extremaustralis]